MTNSRPLGASGLLACSDESPCVITFKRIPLLSVSIGHSEKPCCALTFQSGQVLQNRSRISAFAVARQGHVHAIARADRTNATGVFTQSRKSPGLGWISGPFFHLISSLV